MRSSAKLIDKVTASSSAMVVLKCIAECHERHITAGPRTIKIKTSLGCVNVRNTILLLENAGMIEGIAMRSGESELGVHGAQGFRITERGWTTIGRRPIWHIPSLPHLKEKGEEQVRKVRKKT